MARWLRVNGESQIINFDQVRSVTENTDGLAVVEYGDDPVTLNSPSFKELASLLAESPSPDVDQPDNNSSVADRKAKTSYSITEILQIARIAANHDAEVLALDFLSEGLSVKEAAVRMRECAEKVNAQLKKTDRA